MATEHAPQLHKRKFSPYLLIWFILTKFLRHHRIKSDRAQKLQFKPGFIFVRPIFVQKGKMFTFSRAHSHASTNATRRHKYFRGLSRLLPVPGVLVSFLELCFLGKMALLALGGRPQPLKKPFPS